ncbi:hypothetical protein HNY73_000883 [Argiope bruennichi]|uniref:Uncharacterized protein n=1 Tax=Argiope bruennichi TaxID=94029 RepID=A0A8T0G249_ARGBR|nr:hypothetical protein HNY73_000883 [Argiope bruennichi]
MYGIFLLSIFGFYFIITIRQQTNIAVTTPSHFKLPAVTICNRNMINRTYFCRRYPHLCEKPNDLEEFCQKHPFMCIPKFGYYTNSSENITAEVQDAIQQLTFKISRRKNDMFFFYDTKTWRVTYVYSLEIALYARCYSYNLHIFSKEEPNKLGATDTDTMIIAIMTQEKEETLYPWVESQVFLSIHSPLVPENPIQYGHALRSGYKYEIFLRFEEEYLLPHPYATNCTDYDALWKKNNKTGPRSQEMCREFCEQTHRTPHCYDEEFKKSLELCKENCKPSCMDRIGVVLYIRDRDVTIVSHLPLYNVKRFSVGNQDKEENQEK